LRPLIKDQRGSILPVFAVAVVAVFMAAFTAIEFSRYVVISEKLQIAGDAASSAAALSAKRYVRLRIYPGTSWSVCCSGDECSPCCVSCGDPIEIGGKEDDLIDRLGYKRYCCSCGCDGVPEILDRWVEYENGGEEAKAAAQALFRINKPGEMSESSGGESEITSVEINGDRRSPLYPSVIVRTRGRIKTLFLDFVDRMFPGSDLSYLEASKCSQGGSFYYDLNGKWHRAAQEGCE